MEQKNEWYNVLQDNFWWSGIICIFFIGFLDTDYLIKIFGSAISTTRIVVFCIMGFCFLVSAKKTVTMLSRILKSIGDIKNGEEPGVED